MIQVCTVYIGNRGVNIEFAGLYVMILDLFSYPPLFSCIAVILLIT